MQALLKKGSVFSQKELDIVFFGVYNLSHVFDIYFAAKNGRRNRIPPLCGKLKMNARRSSVGSTPLGGRLLN